MDQSLNKSYLQGDGSCLNLAPIHVLMAEDDEVDRLFISQVFSRTEIETALHMVKDGEQAISFLKKEGPYANVPRPHLIFMDVNMPRKNGLEALSEIKADESLKDIPVVMLTSSLNHHDVHQSYSNHASAYMLKQFSVDQLDSFAADIVNFWYKKVKLPQKENALYP